MTVSTPVRLSSPPRPVLGFGGRLRLVPLKTFARWYDRYLQRRVLAELDSRMLEDIGVTSQEARHEISKPFWC
ncbi:DUF1127 domain-containing protein [Mesorhizobium sp. Z1-4]|uniref:DUF1127 domain-containing protein n=1 Tax=Mesorhizobium sp. Z1-4 TaxID=2448478 RepID=UPI000FD8E283|nr:DUF1127 domain-containing protein [Mesorhizobium sp. Z1-4]